MLQRGNAYRTQPYIWRRCRAGTGKRIDRPKCEVAAEVQRAGQTSLWRCRGEHLTWR
jgi:hypothetical protein